MPTDELRAKRRQLSAQLTEIDSDIARFVTQLERIEAGVEERQEAREASEDERRRAELHAAIAEKIQQRKEVRVTLKSTESQAEKLGRQIKRLSRKIRNAAQPKIVTLALAFRPMAQQGTIIGATGHYTAGPLDDDGDEESLAFWRNYHAAHQAQGWAGLGYQVGFTREGTIVLLRPFTAVGSHTLGYNTGRIGCSVHGTTGHTFSAPQLRAYRYWLRKGHTSRFPTSHRTPRPPKDLELRGHNDFNSTGCPGSFKADYVRGI